MSERARALVAAAAVVCVVACSPSTGRFRWDMERDADMDTTWALKSQRLIVRGLTEREVRSIWGRPHETVTMRGAYKSLLYETRDAWLTVVFDRGRVDRVEAISRRAQTPRTAQTSDASE
ncbi:hypothetical protein CMK11_10260 [Candidatus Poribacteria bacterium]|nr:hypothetical protein [Candidatus Poribacteria bacterium]